MRSLQPLCQRVRTDHDEFDLDFAAPLELRFDLAHVRLEGPTEHVYLKDPRSERVLHRVVNLLCRNAPRERAHGDGDLLLLSFRQGVHEAARSLDRRVFPIEAADDLDVVLELRGLAQAHGWLADDIALPVLDGVAP